MLPAPTNSYSSMGQRAFNSDTSKNIDCYVLQLKYLVSYRLKQSANGSIVITYMFTRSKSLGDGKPVNIDGERYRKNI